MRALSENRRRTLAIARYVAWRGRRCGVKKAVKKHVTPVASALKSDEQQVYDGTCTLSIMS